MSDFCLKIRIFSNHIYLVFVVWDVVCLGFFFFIFKLVNLVRFSSKDNKRYSVLSLLGHVDYNDSLACSKNVLRNLHCHLVHFFWTVESTTWSQFVIRRKVLRNIFWLSYEWCRQGRLQFMSEKTELEELNNCCPFKLLWKSTEIFFPWSHSRRFQKFSSSKLILPLNVFLCLWLCYYCYYLLYFIFSAFLLFFKPCLAKTSYLKWILKGWRYR